MQLLPCFHLFECGPTSASYGGRSGLTPIHKVVLTGRNLEATNQITVSMSGHQSTCTYLCLCKAHYCSQVETSIHMAEEIKDRILVAGRKLGYPFLKQKRVGVSRAFLEGKDRLFPIGFGKSLCYTCRPVALYISKKAYLRVRLFYCVVVITTLIAITDKPGKMFLHFYRYTHA